MIEWKVSRSGNAFMIDTIVDGKFIVEETIDKMKLIESMLNEHATLKQALATIEAFLKSKGFVLQDWSVDDLLTANKASDWLKGLDDG